MATESQQRPPTFGERFSFARWWQELVNRAESDAEFGRAIGRSSTVVGDYRRLEQTPNSGVLQEAAERMGVDYSWLAGRRSAPPDAWPDRSLFLELFPRWLATHRAPGSQPPAGVRDIPVEGMERVTPKKPAVRRRANDR